MRSIMPNELANYCVPDLNTVLFGIPPSDFHSNCTNIITVQNTYWTVNSLSIEDLSVFLNVSIIR